MIYALPIASRWLVYSPLQDLIALVNGEAVRVLREAAIRGGLAELDGAVGELGRELSQKLPEPPRARAGPPRPRFLGLLPTRGCGLSCAYCDFGAERSGHRPMSLEIAGRAIDWMAEHVRGTGGRTLEVHFFGGEPLDAPDVMDFAIHRTRSRASDIGVLPVLEISTNGVFGERTCRLVGDSFSSVVLSIDGTEEAHNLHRPRRGGEGTWRTVWDNARRLSQAPAKLCLRVCVSNLNVEDLPDAAARLCEELCPQVIDFEPLQPNEKSRGAGIERPDPHRFAVRYVEAAAAALRRGVEPVYSAAASDGVRRSVCHVGQDSLVVSPDGRVSACYLPEERWRARGMDLRMGRVDPDGGVTLDHEAVERIRRLPDDKPRCQRCFARWICAGGCHVSQTFPGCGLEYGDFCIQTRLIVAADLLRAMGCAEQIEVLMKDDGARERLASHPDDRLDRVISTWPSRP